MKMAALRGNIIVKLLHTDFTVTFAHSTWITVREKSSDVFSEVSVRAIGLNN